MMPSSLLSSEKRTILLSMFGILLIIGIQTAIWGERGFFYDEAWVANSIHEPTIKEMLFYEKVAQNTPVGLLVLMRGLVALLGNHEWVFRLPALIATLLSIPLLILLSKTLSLSPTTQKYTLLLFITHPLILQYSQEAKQYPLDICTILGIYYFYLLSLKRPSHTHTLLFISVSTFSFLFSYVTPFALGGIAFNEARKWFSTRKIPLEKGIQLGGIALILGICYLFFYRPNHTPHLHKLWILNGAFPTYATWYEPLFFFITSFYKLFSAFSSSVLAPLTILLAAIGGYSYLKAKKQELLCYLGGIFGTLIFLVLAGAYPWAQNVTTIRIQLFLLPLLILFVAEGLMRIEQKITHKRLYTLLIVIGLCTSLFFSITVPTYGRTNDISYIAKEYIQQYAGEPTLIANALQPEFEYYVSDPKRHPNVTILPSRYASTYSSFIDTYIATHRNHSFWFLPSPATAEPRIHIQKFKANCTIKYKYRHLTSELYKIRC